MMFGSGSQKGTTVTCVFTDVYIGLQGRLHDFFLIDFSFFSGRSFL